MISIGAVLKEAVNQLKHLDDARLEAEIILGYVLNKNRAYLFGHAEELLDELQLEWYQKLIKKRVEGFPVAYLTGQREFWSLLLKVTQHTLIPRPETELLVELVLQLISDKKEISILDLGTGSGAIALAIAKERPNWQVSACDISEEALAVAKENAQNLHIKNISFYHSDWFDHLPEERYDAIIANPPYICSYDPHLHSGDLRFEPLKALMSGQDGLADLQYIINHSSKYLLPNGLLLLEHGWEQKNSVNAILNEAGYENIQCWQDIQGHDRVSGARLSK